MTRRKQNCPKRMKWEGGEGEEPPEDVQDDEDGDEEDDDASRHSSAESNELTESRIPSPVTVLQENISNTQPVDLANSESLSTSAEKSPASSKEPSSQRSSTTPPPPLLKRCSSGESLESAGDETIASVFQPVPPRLATMVPTSSPIITSSSSSLAAAAAVAAAVVSPPPLLLPVPVNPAAAVAVPVTPPLKSPLKSPLNHRPSSIGGCVSDDNAAVLDFSTKKRSDKRASASPVLNLSKSTVDSGATAFISNGPLDLSVGSNKKRELEDSPISNSHKKPARMATASPWTSPLLTYQLPYFAPGGVPLIPNAAASPSSVKSSSSSHSMLDSSSWNGKAKLSSDKHYNMLAPSEATKALEKMSELSRLGVPDEFRPVVPLSPSVGGGSGGGGRHSAWQSHWLNKGAEQAKDVLKCVWCKQSFPSLAAMTQHMQEAKHCGVNVPGVSPLQPMASIAPSSQTSSSAISSSSVKSTGGSASSDLNLLIKETMPLPRKLVRGQDVWLGKGAEQTRQILKCMWCGQSFRSLAEMTSHMQQTQHYTNIISQEQIISWKSAEDGKPSSGGGGGGSGGRGEPSSQSSSTNSHVSAVLTCKVCDQAFSSLKELSNHMVKNSHYKEHIMRSITESGGRRRQTREKRKKSLPVRKLLELERAQNELKNGDNMNMMMMMMSKAAAAGLHSSSLPGTGRITCEKCGDKIETELFVEHIRMCVGNGALSSNDKKNFLKNALLSAEPEATTKSGKDPPAFHSRLSPKVTDLSKDKTDKSTTSSSSSSSSSPSVLNAIEKLIEKSFDPRSRHVTHFNSSYFGGGATHKREIKEEEAVADESADESSKVEVKSEPDKDDDARKSASVPPEDEQPLQGEDLSSRRSSSKSDCSPPAASPACRSSVSPNTNLTASPANSERSITPRSSGDKKSSGSLGALSSMFDNLSGVNTSTSSEAPTQSGKASSHPLAALQKLCDKTETHHSSGSGGNGSSRNSSGSLASSNHVGGGPSQSTSPGAILAFSWACNDAVVTDSIMKCAFCDTPFISKGAYRHHLSKVHFVKDGVIPDPVPIKSPNGGSGSSSGSTSARDLSTSSPSSLPQSLVVKNNALAESNNGKTSGGGGGGNGGGGSVSSSSCSSVKSPQQQNSFDESPHSKFLKYTELAKQLSSKYV